MALAAEVASSFDTAGEVIGEGWEMMLKLSKSEDPKSSSDSLYPPSSFSHTHSTANVIRSAVQRARDTECRSEKKAT